MRKKKWDFPYLLCPTGPPSSPWTRKRDFLMELFLSMHRVQFCDLHCLGSKWEDMEEKNKKQKNQETLVVYILSSGFLP